MPSAKSVVGAVNWGMAALFAVAAAVQLNDPDPAAWVAIYGAAALSCLLHGRVARAWAGQAVVGAVALLWGVAILLQVEGPIRSSALFDLGMEMTGDATELVREAGGLFFILMWMAVLAVVGRQGRE